MLLSISVLVSGVDERQQRVLANDLGTFPISLRHGLSYLSNAG